MTLLIPPSKNFSGPLVAVPSLMQDAPKEGRLQVPVTLEWTTAVVGADKCVSFNLQNNAAKNITQISTLKVDNSKCGADVVFIFPDTGDTVTIPAYLPAEVVPVFSNGMQFFVSAPNSNAVDVTRFQILNYHIEPDSVPASVAQQLGVSANLTEDGGDHTIIANTVSGTINALYLRAAIDDAGTLLLNHIYIDGAGRVPGVGAVRIKNSVFNGDIIQQENMHFRFTGGLVLSLSGGVAPVSLLSATVLYQVP